MLISFSFALVLNLIFTPNIIRFSHKRKIYDSTNERKIHTGNIPRIGGIGIFLALLVTGLLAPMIATRIMGTWISPLKKITPNLFLTLGAVLILLTGLWDDLKEIKAWTKFGLQIVSALLACMGGAVIKRIMIPFLWTNLELGFMSWPITILWIVAIINAINLIDGMDGLAGTISLIAAAVYGITFMLADQFMLSIISFTLAGAISGFLFFNFPQAQIFMGDSGALFLGYLLGVLPLAAAPESGGSLILPLTMLVIPIGDVISAIIRRNREGTGFFTPDREHMHHKLLNMGQDERAILSLVCIFSFLFGICTILQFYLPARRALILIFTDWIIGVLFFTLLHYLNKHNKKKHNISNNLKG